jgi:hypothetical protein
MPGYFQPQITGPTNRVVQAYADASVAVGEFLAYDQAGLFDTEHTPRSLDIRINQRAAYNALFLMTAAMITTEGGDLSKEELLNPTEEGIAEKDIPKQFMKLSSAIFRFKILEVKAFQQASLEDLAAHAGRTRTKAESKTEWDTL